MDVEELVEQVLAGQRRALARLLTRVEDGSQQQVSEAVALLHPHTGRARIAGLTGSPGVGKSTVSSALVGHWRAQGLSVAVLAVDPSSPFSGGALLGDRVRMQDHVLDEGVFVRSMASRGHLGGLSWAAPQALTALDAAGFDVVLVETVGVGQAEVEVAGVADTVVVAVAPGMGDAIQAAKAGVLEIADVFCVNKADRDGAGRTARELREMQRMGAGHDDDPDAWTPPVCKTVASSGEGVDELAGAIDAHHAHLQRSGELRERRVQRARLQVREIALAQVRQRLGLLSDGELLDEVVGAVADRALDPYAGAQRLLDALADQGLGTAGVGGG